MFRPHLHCVVPGGGLSADGQRWVHCRARFFLSVRVLSRLFQCLFMERLETAFNSAKLQFFGSLEPLRNPGIFAERIARAKESDWVVYAKRPFAAQEAGTLASASWDVNLIHVDLSWKDKSPRPGGVDILHPRQ